MCDIRDKIEAALNNYTHTRIVHDGGDFPMGLADLLTPFEGQSIQYGKDEIHLIADFIAGDLDDYAELPNVILKNYEKIKKTMPSTQEMEVINMSSQHGWIDSPVVSKEMKVSLSQASTLLKSASDKGFLKKQKLNSKGPGLTYLYLSILHDKTYKRLEVA